MTRKIISNHFTISATLHDDLSREFFISTLKPGNPFNYVCHICGLVFNTKQDAEKAIILKLKTMHGFYKKTDGTIITSVDKPMYKRESALSKWKKKHES